MVISSFGVGSGIDLKSLLDGLLNSERIPQENHLDEYEAEYQYKFSAFGQIYSYLASASTRMPVVKLP